MVNVCYEAGDFVKSAESKGLSHRKIAEICNVEVGTVSRWKSTGRARESVIGPLKRYLAGQRPRRFLDEASLEELWEEVADRAQKLGSQASITLTKIPSNLTLTEK